MTPELEALERLKKKWTNLRKANQDNWVRAKAEFEAISIMYLNCIGDVESEIAKLKEAK